MIKRIGKEIINSIIEYFNMLRIIQKWFQDHTTTFVQCVCLKCNQDYTRIVGNIRDDGTTFYCPECKRVKYFTEVL